MSKILKNLGLNVSQVRALLGVPTPSNSAAAESSLHENNKYWYGPKQRIMAERISACETWMVSEFLINKRKPEDIALLVGVSIESVRKRLRKRKLFNSNGKAGRPMPLKPR